jgi:ribonuclease Z
MNRTDKTHNTSAEKGTAKRSVVETTKDVASAWRTPAQGPGCHRLWSIGAALRAAALGLLVVLTTASARAQEITVTLLGTGAPLPSMERFGPSILVQAGTQMLIFDAGRGAIQRLTQVGVTYDQVDALFLTHLHSDHVVGIPDLWLTGWIQSRRTKGLPVFGPDGTAAMMGHLEQAFEFDRRLRVEDDKIPKAGSEIRATDIAQGVVYEKDGVRVIAFDVDHRPVVPALGYRIEYAGRAVILSGDTRFSPNLIKFAEHAELVVHEVGDSSDAYLAQNPNFRTALAHHIRPQEAGRVFQAVKPRLAVYSHIVARGANAADLVTHTRETYAGPLVVGEDLMRFVVGADVAVYRP